LKKKVCFCVPIQAVSPVGQDKIR